MAYFHEMELLDVKKKNMLVYRYQDKVNGNPIEIRLLKSETKDLYAKENQQELNAYKRCLKRDFDF